MLLRIGFMDCYMWVPIGYFCVQVGICVAKLSGITHMGSNWHSGSKMDLIGTHVGTYDFYESSVTMIA